MPQAAEHAHRPSASGASIATGRENPVSEKLPINPAFTNMLNGARERIYQAWLPHVPQAEAIAEADAFALRFYILVDGPMAPLTEPELDQVLDIVADAMAEA